METEKFKLADIFYAIVIPIILVLLIFVLAVYVNVSGTYHVLGQGAIAVILTQGFSQMIVLGIPLVIGLLWNKWAGGAAGFIMGGMYYVASAGLYTGYYTTYNPPQNFFGDISMLFYLVNAVIIGYMAGALTKGSTNFKRMLGAGLTAAITVGVLQFVLNYSVSFGAWMTQGNPGDALFKVMLPMIILGFIGPIIAKVMTWYGLQPVRHQ